MVVGVLDITVVIREARSLKDKRRIINSLKDRVGNKFNVSIAEVDKQNMCQAACLGVTNVSSDARYVRSSLEKVAAMVRSVKGVQVSDYHIEIFHC